MWFRRLHVDQLRNLNHQQLELGPGLNYFFGPNGAGKSALLEAIHVLARGRSFRGQSSAELIQRDCAHLVVRAEIQDEHRGLQSIAVARHRGGRAEVRLNGEPAARLSQVAELLPLQIMVPSLSELVFGPPSGRRQWLDWGTFHVKPDYLRALRGYNQILRQRNAALKSVASGSLGPGAVTVWTERLVQSAEAVTRERAEYVDLLTPVLVELLGVLAPGSSIELTFQRGWPAERELGNLLSDSFSREVKSGVTQLGPHRADVELRIGGMAAALTLSRGQGKMLASAMMLAQARLLMEHANRASVFLIDDIGAELDSAHGGRFFEVLYGLRCQILATSTTEPAHAPELSAPESRTFHVEHGRVTTGRSAVTTRRRYEDEK